jgi:hypothetical protein
VRKRFFISNFMQNDLKEKYNAVNEYARPFPSIDYVAEEHRKLHSRHPLQVFLYRFFKGIDQVPLVLKEPLKRRVEDVLLAHGVKAGLVAQGRAATHAAGALR